MPPATGTCLSISSRTPPGTRSLRASSRAARIARFEASVATPEVSTLPVKDTEKSLAG